MADLVTLRLTRADYDALMEALMQWSTNHDPGLRLYLVMEDSTVHDDAPTAPAVKPPKTRVLAADYKGWAILSDGTGNVWGSRDGFETPKLASQLKVEVYIDEAMRGTKTWKH